VNEFAFHRVGIRHSIDGFINVGGDDSNILIERVLLEKFLGSLHCLYSTESFDCHGLGLQLKCVDVYEGGTTFLSKNA
jgi:hypothetical protein